MGLEEFRRSAEKVAQAIAGRPLGTHWLIDCDTDADGLSAAAVMANALRSIGHRFTIRPSREKNTAAYLAVFANDVHGHMFLDKGTSHVALLAENGAAHGRPVVVVDHHNVDQPIPAGAELLNPRSCGLDGSRDASGATTAAILALALVGDKALPWAAASLAGAVGDWQHMGGWQGWNRELVDRCRAAGHLRQDPMVRLPGVTLAEAISHAEPAIAGLRDQPRDAAVWLGSLALPSEAEVEELDLESRTRLVSAIALRHLAAGDAHAVGRVVGPVDVIARLGVSVRQAFRLVDACGREDRPGTGISFLLGDPAAKADAAACFARYKGALADGVRAIREKGTDVRKAVQVAWTASPAYTGMVAGAAMTHIVAERGLPLAVLAKRPDGRIQASTRGTHEQVAAGMDLGAACKAAAVAVGAEGGGHPVAAGAVVPAEHADRFIAHLDAALVGQGFRSAP